ncbi:MAG: hypothetical protein P4L51_04780 [Puia sp.]|nr:hypothetical protein [Puia sp.]
MNNQEEYIDQYLNGTMSEEEKQSFLRRLEEDAAFRQEFVRQEKLADMVRLAALQEQLESIHLEMESGDGHTGLTDSGAADNRLTDNPPDALPSGMRSAIKKISAGWWLAAAAVILLVVLGDYLLTRYSRPPEEKIFAAWYAPAPGLPTTMGAGQNDIRLMDAMVDYKTKEYSSAAGKFKALLPDTVAVFYLASSYMGAGQYDSAYLFFRRLAGTHPTGWPDHYTGMAQWYEALSCLRLKKVTEARSILQAISGITDHPYREKALKLSKELPAL